MKRNFLKTLALLAFIPMIAGMTSCNNQNSTYNPDILFPDREQPELSDFAKENGCTGLGDVIEKITNVESEETYKVCGIIKEINDQKTGEMTITDTKNVLFIQKIEYFKQLPEKPKVGDEVVVEGKVSAYYGNPAMKLAKIVKIKAGTHIDEGGDDNNKPNPNPDHGGDNSGSSSLFESEAVKNSASRGNKGSIDDYYKSCKGLKGVALKNELNEIINSGKHFITYGGLREVANDVDADPKHPGNIMLCYTLESHKKLSTFSNDVNREHTWPRMYGDFKDLGLDANSDAHMVRACDASLNSERGNSFFGEVPHTSSNEIQGCWSTGSVFEPADYTKGDTARLMFYMATAYDYIELDRPSDLSKYEFFGTKPNNGNLGDFDVLYKWATDPNIDKIDEYEMRRNNLVDQNWQHNRNPFVDHPEFIEMIWDKTYSGPGALE